MDPNQKTMMVDGFVAAFAKATRVSDVPEEAVTSDTREPSYMFLAANLLAKSPRGGRAGTHARIEQLDYHSSLQWNCAAHSRSVH